MKKLSHLLLSCGLIFSSDMVSSCQINWQTTQLPKPVSLRGSAVHGQSLWVTGTDNSVFVSQDGGKTWLDKSVDSEIKTDFRDIELFDENTAIVMGVGTGQQSTLFITSNGGKSWQTLFQNQDKDGFFDSISFWDRNNGLLMGDPVDGFYVIKRTRDGGKTWNRIPIHQLPKFKQQEMAFAASGNTLITGSQGKAWFTTGGVSASVYSSNDFGNNWSRTQVPLYLNAKTAGGYALALNNQEQLFVLGGDYQQRGGKYNNLATLDDSDTKNEWRVVSNEQRGLRTAMTCVDNICISTGKLSSDISHDHGKTWQALLTDKNETGFYTLASDNNIILAAGADGKLGVIKLSDNSQPVK